MQTTHYKYSYLLSLLLSRYRNRRITNNVSLYIYCMFVDYGVCETVGTIDCPPCSLCLLSPITCMARVNQARHGVKHASRSPAHRHDTAIPLPATPIYLTKLAVPLLLYTLYSILAKYLSITSHHLISYLLSFLLLHYIGPET